MSEENPEDRESKYYVKGDYKGELEEVRKNIQRCGCLEVCEFVKGWFSDTMPGLDQPILLAHIDVDLEASLDTCVRHLWPNLNDNGWIFTDEACSLDYVSLFFSEKWWRENFQSHPPGLIGAGTGLVLGEYYVGPHDELGDHPYQHGSTGAYTSKSMSSHWTYYPDEEGDENVR